MHFNTISLITAGLAAIVAALPHRIPVPSASDTTVYRPRHIPPVPNFSPYTPGLLDAAAKHGTSIAVTTVKSKRHGGTEDLEKEKDKRLESYGDYRPYAVYGAYRGDHPKPPSVPPRPGVATVEEGDVKREDQQDDGKEKRGTGDEYAWYPSYKWYQALPTYDKYGEPADTPSEAATHGMAEVRYEAKG